ncbi:SUMF1/EgtB/PvdO family nonheme iron enzyme [Pseudomonas soli]|uniref:Formylglycine-generating enzyme, required for sulfatase activity, contains SUMF1/FGE domain n=2 Tax=Pseudomonas soli TaxID=1306993 RepID=A0A1H9LID0_9PSED|nr:SUMF1/EgtB/PvdO family nonheme iron enzyme [Pseudomonas soli]MDT3715195.1 SUMF1/EgtB/PvdO family nonheme iron enzyme [Pseudomonas soli]MDT3731608.1 SUMF1/EgtB/PvdO family nonheme iron enzyme [Pseudomonas soli]SER11160.1 Formylglycine-generating enzyme, required for sulfatase activity, contains SUMF1/FGE domain [Pseudomonas soli]
MNSYKQWHWPRLPSPLPKDVSDRALMGYPEQYQEHPLQAKVSEAFADLLQAPLDVLLAILEQPRQPLARRIGAGEVLALRGDPRIDTFAPDMIDIPAARVHIGLDPGAVTQVMEQFDGLGLDRSWIDKETPRHAVELAAFRIARFPVTHQEYRQFLLDSGHTGIPDGWAFGRYPRHHANHPVYSVSASDADAYARWLSERTGRRFALPTEAQWEYAAAGPEGRQFPWGDAYQVEHANTAELGYLDSTPVGVFIDAASPFGVLDMAGNVEEYVAEDYQPYPGGPCIEDDLVLDVGTHRVARGGSFTRFRDLARTARRHGRYPRPIYVMGLRLVENHN